MVMAASSAAAAVLDGTATGTLAQQKPTQTFVSEREADGMRIVKPSYRDPVL